MLPPDAKRARRDAGVARLTARKDQGGSVAARGASGSELGSRVSTSSARSAAGGSTKKANKSEELFTLDAGGEGKKKMTLQEVIAKIWSENYSPGREIRGVVSE
jgi:hypothetical protein